MATAHEIDGEDSGETFEGPWHLVLCSCGEQFQEGPRDDLTPASAKAAAYEAWKLHLHGA